MWQIFLMNIFCNVWILCQLLYSCFLRRLYSSFLEVILKWDSSTTLLYLYLEHANIHEVARVHVNKIRAFIWITDDSVPLYVCMNVCACALRIVRVGIFNVYYCTYIFYIHLVLLSVKRWSKINKELSLCLHMYLYMYIL